MEIRITRQEAADWKIPEAWNVVDERGCTVSGAGVSTVDSWLGRSFVRTNIVGGVATPPEHRRRGYVRQLFDEIFEKAPEYGWAVSLLHPFSFSYYRQFGYERVGDHRILTFPMRALEFIPRYKDFEPLGEHADEAIALFNEWARGRNISFRRGGSLFAQDCFGDHGASVYTVRENGVMTGYAAVAVQNHLNVNHMEGDYLHVHELVYRDREALYKLLGLLRMFDGQNDVVRIHNCAMAPEIELTLRHYTHTHIEVLPDIMARALDLPALLEQNVWPEESGGFVIRVEDSLPRVGGVWQAEYGNGGCEIRRADGKTPSATFTAASVMPLLYGYEAYSEELLRYAPGVQVDGDVRDLVRAFPKRNCGLYEHF